jgi:hypothetical protein
MRSGRVTGTAKLFSSGSITSVVTGNMPVTTAAPKKTVNPARTLALGPQQEQPDVKENKDLSLGTKEQVARLQERPVRFLQKEHACSLLKGTLLLAGLAVVSWFKV